MPVQRSRTRPAIALSLLVDPFLANVLQSQDSKPFSGKAHDAITGERSTVYAVSMEARENEPQVRPIPIVDEDGVLLPEAGAPRRARSGSPPRPLLPLAVAGTAISVLVLAVTLFGAVEFRDAPASDPETFAIAASDDEGSSPPETIPPSLEEAIPGITDRLTLITTDGSTLWTLVWDPSYRVPKPFSMTSPLAESWSSASFDASGRVVNVLGGSFGTAGPQNLWLGQPAQFDQEPDLDEVWSVAWHASEVSRLAYVTFVIGADSDAVLQLWTTDIDPLTNTHSPPEFVTEFTSLANIVRWDTSGFLIQMGDQTVALDSSGEELWANDGWSPNASPNHFPQVRMTGADPQWFLSDRATGDGVSFTEFGINASAIETTVVAAQSNDLFAAATYREAGTTITVIAPKLGAQLSAPRVVHVVGHPTLSQFTSDASYLILEMNDTNDLLFLNWRTGAIHPFGVPDDQTVLALNLG